MAKPQGHPKDALAANLKRAREAAGLTQEEAAGRIKRHKQSLTNWETGVKRPTEENVRRLAALYGTTAAALRYGTAGPALVGPSSVQEPRSSYGETRTPALPQSLAVRVWRDELRLELTRAHVPEAVVEDTLALVAGPAVVVYFAGDVASLEALADLARVRLVARGFKGVKRKRG